MEHLINSFDEPAKVIRRADVPEEPVYALTFKEAFLNYFQLRFSKEGLSRFVNENFPQKKDSAKEKLRKIIRGVSFVLLVLGLSYMIFYYYGYRERINDLNDWKGSISTIVEEELFPFEIEKLWENIKNQYPDIDFPEGMQLKFAALYAMNQHTAGVLSIEEKGIWTPVLLNKTNPDYYMWKDIYGEYNRYGNPYIDYRCNIKKGDLSKNTIIYGHNTHDKLGFNKLTTYMTVAGYREAPVVVLDTLYEKTQWKIFAVILTNSTSVADRGNLFRYLVTDFSSNAEFMTMIRGINERSMIKTEVDVNADDKILTLYTCYQDIFDGGRLVVFARLLRDGESAEVDVSKASFNHNARYPQAYYDQMGLTNPFSYPEQDTTTEASSSKEENTTKVSQEKTTASSQEKTTSSVKETTSASKDNETTVKTEETASVVVQETTTKKPASEEKPENASKPAEATTKPAAPPASENKETAAATGNANAGGAPSGNSGASVG